MPLSDACHQWESRPLSAVSPPPPPGHVTDWLGGTDTEQRAELKVTFNTRVRNRLEQLLGTDMLRLNDRQYMRTLMRRIYQDQENSLQRRAESRQMQENKRLKGLVEDMKMEKPPDMVETAFVVSFKKTKAQMEKVQRKQFNKRHNIKRRKTVSCAELDSDDETSPDVEDITTNEQYHNSSFLGTTLDLSAEEDDSLAEEQRQRELAQLAIKFGKYKEPLVQLLLQEGTVPRLYDLAEIILVKPPKQQKKKAAVEAEEQAAAVVEPDEPASGSAEDDSDTDEEDEGEEGEETDDIEAEEAAEGAEAEAGADQAPAAEGEAPAEGEVTGGDSESTDGAAPDTSEVENSETVLEEGDNADTEAEAVETGEEVAPSEGYITAEEPATAAKDESAAEEGDEDEEQEEEAPERREEEERRQQQEAREEEEEEEEAGGGETPTDGAETAEPYEDEAE